MATWRAIDRDAHTAIPAIDAAPRSILLALDGDTPTRGAVGLARWLGERDGAAVQVLSVVEPARSFLDDEGRVERTMAMRCATRRATILDQIGEYGPWNAPGDVSVVPGAPVSVLAEAVNASDVDLVIVGMPSNTGRPAYHDGSALRVLRRSAKPVVAVMDDIRVPPRCCVAALDFTHSSLHAARVALSLLAPGGTLVLAHVQPPLDAADPLLQSVYSHGIVAAFEGVRRELQAPASVRIVPELLDGSLGSALAALCDRAGADLLAMGTTRPDAVRFSRARLSTRFLRAGRPSLVFAPPAMRTANSTFAD